MRKQLWSLTGLVAFGLSAAPLVHAQQPPVQRQVAKQQNLNWAEKMFSELSHDFGKVAKGSDVHYDIPIKNIYEEDVQIGTVTSSCGCTSPSVDKQLLKSHDEARLQLKVNTVQFSHQKNPTISITMTFRDKQGRQDTKIVQVPLSVYIRPDVVLTPGNADFGTVEVGQPSSRKLNISYAGRQDWNITGVRVKNELLKADVKEVGRSAGRVNYELTVNFTGAATMGSLNDQVTLITNDPQAPEVPVLVMARVEPDIIIANPTQVLGNLQPGQEKQFTVVLRGKRPFVIAGVHCESERDCLEVGPTSTEPKAVHLVQFKMKAPSEPGKIAEKLTFTISDRTEPLTCIAEATVVGG